MKVIYHVDAMEAWAMALGNVRNMLDWLQHNQKDYEIEVLANGPAVRGYLPGILSDSLYVIMAQAKRKALSLRPVISLCGLRRWTQRI